ncbi:hypothetical protein ABZZ17_23125 [Streptomyces sp. NPDC006512]|uniref:hypothetical protein n=1 Tax=Streptomyces sp. NPDC006512 TaxID=3154307 RepID=UPI0033ACB34D
MHASDAVLAELDSMSETFAYLYDRVMRLEEGNPAPDGSFERSRPACCARTSSG